ncbi:MAG: metal-sulfur cluster assembly factor [Elusimicrobia bacterium]|nr:metal-sulfur cluster assembly factor [Candidatus Obscuribacterium magneticum]
MSDQPVNINPYAQTSTGFPTESEIIDALRAVEDPELHLNMIELGLIYKVERDAENGKITVDMTLTTPACPYGPQLFSQARAVLSRLPQVREVKINPVFNPPWDPRVHASDDVKMMLGLI